jgi:hypothetical protein
MTCSECEKQANSFDMRWEAVSCCEECLMKALSVEERINE